MPPMHLVTIQVEGESIPLTKYYFKGTNGKANRIKLSHNQNHFSLMFSIPDFINSANYIINYSVNGGKTWVNNGSSRIVSFSGPDYGSFNFCIKYTNMETGAESDIYRAIIAITPPWYLSTLAKIIYMVFVIAAIFFIAAYFMPKQRQKQSTMLKKMEQAHKEEMYEEKLRFFTNITHEFCTPLTLIYGGCERILAGIDENSHL